MELAALLLLLILICWLQESGGTQCTVELMPQEGTGGTKLQMLLDCPSCNSLETTLEVSDTCNFYGDLELDEECINTDRQCRETYFLQNASSSSSNAKTDAADVFEESDGEYSTTILAMGAVIGILVVLLGVVLTGWGWTCWIIKQRGAMATTVTQSNKNKSKEGEQADKVRTEEPIVLVLHNNEAYETHSYRQAQCTTSLVPSTLQIENEHKEDIPDKECNTASQDI